MAADAEKTTDLQNREQGMSFVVTDDEIIDLADALVLVVDDSVAGQACLPDSRWQQLARRL